MLDEPTVEECLGLAAEGRFPAGLGLGRPAVVVITGRITTMEAQERHDASILPLGLLCRGRWHPGGGSRTGHLASRSQAD
jgi:hypothetical protein